MPASSIVGQDSRESWIPVPTLAASGGRRVLYTTIALSPQLLPLEPDEAEAAEANARIRTPGPWEEVRLEDASESALQKLLAKEAAHFARHEASPTLRALHEAASLLKELDHRSEELEGQSGQESAQVQEHLAECSAGWRELGEAEIRRLTPKSRLRLRQRGGEDPSGREVLLLAQLRVTGEPGTQDTVWEVQMLDGSEPKVQYFNLLRSDFAVGEPCQGTRPDINASEADARLDTLGQDHVQASSMGDTVHAEWPACIEVGVSTRSLDGSGLFVNLEALGISSGCFRDDCSHSDHFEAAAPAECAKICQKIGACRTWTFWESTPSTCWLRGSASGQPVGRIDAAGAVSGSLKCAPAFDADAQGPAEPTLLSLIAASSGTIPPSLWQEWDLVGTLSELGHLTLQELRRLRPSARQRSALRIAAKALDPSAWSRKPLETSPS